MADIDIVAVAVFLPNFLLTQVELIEIGEMF